MERNPRSSIFGDCSADRLVSLALRVIYPYRRGLVFEPVGVMAGISEKLYQCSPIWAQQLQVAAYGWWWHRRRFGKDFHRLVGELKTREKWTVSQFRDYQASQLKHLLLAAARSKYYSQAFAKAGIAAGREFT